MKKIFFILFFISNSSNFILSQDNEDINNLSSFTPKDSIAHYIERSKSAYKKGDFSSFKKYCDSVLHIASRHNMHTVKAQALINLGVYYNNTDKLDKSLEKYLEASKIIETSPDKEKGKLSVLINIGNLYNRLGDYNKAESKMLEAIDIAIKLNNPEKFLIAANNGLAITSTHKKDYSKALGYLQKVKDLAIKTQQNDVLIIALNNIGDCYIKLNRFQDAINISNEVLSYITEDESIESKAFSKLNIGASMIALGKNKEALKPLNEAKDIASKGGFLKIKMNAHNYLSKSYESLGNIEHSFKEQKDYLQAREQYLSTLSKAQRLAFENESKIKSEIIGKQQQSISTLNKEKWLYALLGTLLLIILLVFFSIYRKKRKHLALKSKTLESDKAKLQTKNIALNKKLDTLFNETQQILKNKTISNKEKKVSISKKEQDMYMKQILDYMDSEKPFLNHEIKQSDLAEKLGITVHLFSEILNVNFQKNFNHFINSYRVEKAKALMQNPKYINYKILSIGYEAGFPSKTSFNRVFKNFVGLTPSEYQKKQFTS